MNIQQLIAALIARLAETDPSHHSRSLAHLHHWNSCRAWTIYTFQVAYGLDEQAAERAIDQALTEQYDRLLSV